MPLKSVRPARILLPTFGSFGDIHPFLALAIEIGKRGHRPVLATSELYRSKIEAEEIEFLPLRPDLPPQDEWKEFVPRLMEGIHGPQRLFQDVLMPSLRDAYADLLPAAREADLVVTHSIVHAAPLAAEVAGKKWLTVALAPLALWSVYDPPGLPNLPGNEWLHERPTYHRAVKVLVRRLSASWVQEVPRFRRELQLPPISHALFEGAHSPHGVLALFSRELGAPQPDWPERTTQTGFCFYDRKGQFFGEAEYAKALAPAVQEFLAAGEPPIVFTLGSAAVFAPRNFFHAAVEAAQALGRRTILLIGQAENRPQNLPVNSERIAAFEYAPFGDLFPQAAAVVHQGGVGTTGQVLRAGVPSLVLPYSHDQPDHAMRLQRRGVARSITGRKYSGAVLAKELEGLLSDTSYKARAVEIGQRVRRENGTAAAVDAIEAALTAQP